MSQRNQSNPLIRNLHSNENGQSYRWCYLCKEIIKRVNKANKTAGDISNQMKTNCFPVHLLHICEEVLNIQGQQSSHLKHTQERTKRYKQKFLLQYFITQSSGTS